MAASVGQIVQMLNNAEKDLAAVNAMGTSAAAGLAAAAGTVKTAGAGVPNPNLALNIQRHQQTLTAAFSSVMEVAPLIRQAAVDIQAAFGRGR